MSYPKVIAILDAQLERLRAARAVLTAKPNGRRATDGVDDLVEVTLESAGVSLPPAQPSPVEPRRIAARQKRERRSTPRKKHAGEETAALRGLVPAAPVYVSAAKVRSAQQEKEEQNAPPAEPELTAEILSHRWLRS